MVLFDTNDLMLQFKISIMDEFLTLARLWTIVYAVHKMKFWNKYLK